MSQACPCNGVPVVSGCASRLESWPRAQPASVQKWLRRSKALNDAAERLRFRLLYSKDKAACWFYPGRFQNLPPLHVPSKEKSPRPTAGCSGHWGVVGAGRERDVGPIPWMLVLPGDA